MTECPWVPTNLSPLMSIQQRATPPTYGASFSGIILENEIFLSGRGWLALLDLGGEAEHMSI